MSIGLPVVVLVAAVGFVAFCLYDLIRTPQVRHLPKAAWALIILVSIPLGGIVYVRWGRHGGRALPTRTGAGWWGILRCAGRDLRYLPSSKDRWGGSDA